MFRHRHSTLEVPVPPSRVASVRLLHGQEELQAAVERARAFERRQADEYQRRVGTYDRFLLHEERSANIVPIAPDGAAEVSALVGGSEALPG